MASVLSAHVPNLWDDAKAPTDPVDQLIYASNLLGSDLRVTNFGGGNTSSKIFQPDPLSGESTEVLWVKGSGGDLGSAKRGNFASLYQGRLLALEAKVKQEGLHEDQVVALYNHCNFNLNPVACSIDTPLHSYVPFQAVSHMHADAVIAIAASENAKQLCSEIWGSDMGYLPWKRPGFDLGLMLRDLIAENPGIKGALMASHGFICWADDWKSCYALTIDMINKAQEYINSKTTSTHAFGQVVRPKLSDEDARTTLLNLLPTLRGKVAFEGKRLIACVDRSEAALDFMARSKMDALAALGTSCPDHFLRTKIRPLVLSSLPSSDKSDRSDLSDYLDKELATFRENYAAYYERCKRPNSPAMRNPNPSVVLVPGVGMISFGKNPQEAKVTGQFYRNAIEVMRGAETVGKYVALPEQEAFDIEYWLLEEAKLKRQPPESEFSRQIAVITGGAQGIGLATAKKLAKGGACVVILDINEEKLAEAVPEIEAVAANKGSVVAVRADVTDLSDVSAAFEEAILKFGGVDLCTVSAGNARRGTVADTTDADYDFQAELLMKGYFLAMRAATQTMIQQGTGGSLVVIASKNGVAVGGNAAVYSAAKAFELHLMRTTAGDLAKHGIRCNAVNPDAVLIGSGIWNDAWKQQTAKTLGISVEELPEHYRKRSLLGVIVSADDCAEATCWLLSEARSSRTTGCTITVDGGVKEGFLR
ncbi:MAG: bifunctional rhamnulose-1-phosphate aldolase/short-chain dehydrogenase [Armatimonadetes bacterium]|nr:bifunctional rhamnulose-1-phosphate aldolase/short-chain dehydrogenase [Armatimonadota bacterium]